MTALRPMRNLGSMKVLVVYKKSRFELYRDSSDKAVQDFLTSAEAEIMRTSHNMQEQTLDTVVENLNRLGISYNKIYRADLDSYPIDPSNLALIIAVGGDGTFLEVSHYVRDIPILGVNSSPDTSVGFFCCYNRDDFLEAIRDLDNLPTTKLNRLEITINNQPIPPTLNDILFAHSNPAHTTSYELANNTKRYKCSGLLACTAAGSTARMYQEGGIIMPLSSAQLQSHNLVVRNSGFNFADELEITSLTREGMVYIDGPHLRYEAGLGAKITIKSGSPLTVIGDLESKRKCYG